MPAHPARPLLSEVAEEDFVEGADSVVAGDFAAVEALVSVEAASVGVIVACLRHAVAAR